MLANVNKDDGSDALINAILVARGDALPTKFAGDPPHSSPVNTHVLLFIFVYLLCAIAGAAF